VKQQIPPEAIAAWDRGDRLDAIRLLRERTGLGLKAAKEALEYRSDRMASTLPEPRPAPTRRSAPGEVPRSSRAVVYTLAFAVLLLLFLSLGFPG
jgi:hypothetical protein